MLLLIFTLGFYFCIHYYVPQVFAYIGRPDGQIIVPANATTSNNNITSWSWSSNPAGVSFPGTKETEPGARCLALEILNLFAKN